MEARIRIDGALFERARQLTGLSDPQALVSHVMQRFIEGEAMARIARLRASSPDADFPPRWRPEPPSPKNMG